MNIRLAVSLSEPTLTSLDDSKRACPWYTVQFVKPLSQLSTSVLEAPEIASFLDFTSFMSTLTGPLGTTPKSAARRATWAACALAIIVLVGVQPVFTHVPPNNFRSMITTLNPAPARRCARKGPA
jgi:hypothetical protein